MSYFSFFGLSEDPFIKNAMIGRQSFRSRDHDNAINQMEQATERNGLCVIIGKSGSGKSHAVDRFITSVDTTKHICIHITPGDIPSTDFHKLIAVELKLDPTGKLQTLRYNLKRHFYDFYTRGRPLILVINEAQDVRVKVLKDLRNLMSYKNDTLDAITIILVGEPDLAVKLENTVELTSLNRRVTNRYRFVGLSSDEVRSYVNHKLTIAGGTDLLVDDEAMSLLNETSHGVSGDIDQLMTDALAYGAQKGRSRIDAEIMQFAIDHRSLL